MNQFKFLSKNKKVFTFEITGRMYWRPAVLMDSERWSHERSVLIKEWLSDYFYNNHPNGFNLVKYFTEFDRYVRIIETGLDTYNHQRVFTAKINIYRDFYEYMEIELMYPI
jgi:hypothetical protein